MFGDCDMGEIDKLRMEVGYLDNILEKEKKKNEEVESTIDRLQQKIESILDFEKQKQDVQVRNNFFQRYKMISRV